MIAILYPLPHIAYRVIQPPGVRRERAYRRRLLVIPLAAAAIAVSAVLPDLIAPPIGSLRPRSGRVLPLCRGGQPVALAGLLGKPLGIGHRILPRHNDHWPAPAAPTHI